MKKLLWLLLMLAGTIGYGQSVKVDRVQKGVEAFYQAEFEAAQTIMRRALSDPTLPASDRFDAHLYYAFSLIRLNGQPDSIRSHLQQAVAIDPGRELNTHLIPPDLYEQYHFVRQANMGSLWIESDPSAAIAVCYDRRSGKSVSMNTPAAFLNLNAGEFDFLLHAPGHDDLQTVIQVHAGRTDTLFFQLGKLSKPWYRSWWALGGGGASILLAWFIFNREDDTGGKDHSELPLPPSRP